jgi:hypothetical protein
MCDRSRPVEKPRVRIVNIHERLDPWMRKEVSFPWFATLKVGKVIYVGQCLDAASLWRAVCAEIERLT